MARKTTKRKATSGKRTQRGKGVRDILKKAHSYVKANKLISRGLRLAGKPGLAALADQAGYGKRKKKRTVKRRSSIAVRPAVKRRRSTAVRGTLMPSSVMRGRGVGGIAIKNLTTPGIRSMRGSGMKGRGFFGKTLGGLAGGMLGGMLPF